MFRIIVRFLIPTFVLVSLSASGCSMTASTHPNGEGIAEFEGVPTVRAAEAMTVTATALPGAGDVLIVGGADGKKSSKLAEFYTPSTKKFIHTRNAAVDRLAPCGAILAGAGAKVLLAGGAQASAKGRKPIVVTLRVTPSVEEYDPSKGTFTASGNPMSAARMGCTATLLDDGTILVAGGLDGTGTPLNTAEVFDPMAGTFSPTSGNMNSPRAFHSATLLPAGPLAGDVLIAGGMDNYTPGGGQGETVGSAELYDPSTKTFTLTTGSMATSRAFHTATLLADGMVLVAGGDSAAKGGIVKVTGTAELFDPSTSTFGATGSLTEGRMMHTATLLPDGTLVAGGFEVFGFFLLSGAIDAVAGPTSQSAEVYDPLTKTFACVGGLNNEGSACNLSMKKTHAGHLAVLLNDGTVLIAGGYGGSKPFKTGGTIRSAEIYSPDSKSFAKIQSMKNAHAQGVAVLLQ